jgi:CheY-like chemotaxis protein
LTHFALHVIEDYTGYLMGKRILVADDSRTIQQAFAMVMVGSDYELSFAKSVDEALAVAKRDGRPDLVLSDAMLGSGSGYDLCAGLKADADLHDVPVYILASAHNPYDDARGRKVGADGHLAKPFESQALLDAVASALATPVRPVSSVMPQFSADFNDNTARISSKDVPLEDDDSYGEITIERGPPASTPAQSAWTATKPPQRPSGMRPIVAAASAAPPVVPPAPRPSLIPGARPSASMPVARTGTTPQPTPPTPAPGSARPALNRTMMGFPSVKAPVSGKPAEPAAPTPAAPMPLRAAVPVPVAANPSRPVMLPTPAAPAAPVATKPLLPPPTGVTPMAPAQARPPAPRFSPPPSPASAPAALPAPVARRAPTPVPASAGAEPPSVRQTSPALAAVLSAAVDEKVAALSARGPDYEAIAKLSREIIEQVVWEVVPELAEMIIRQEIDRLASAKK